jgi:hypothetical protein
MAQVGHVLGSRPRRGCRVGSLDYYALGGDDFYYSLCARTVGSGTPPVPIGGSSAASSDIDAMDGDGTVSRHVSDVLPAGTYDVGMCARASGGNVDPITSYASPGGWVMVIDGSGPLSKAGPPAPAKPSAAP